MVNRLQGAGAAKRTLARNGVRRLFCENLEVRCFLSANTPSGYLQLDLVSDQSGKALVQDPQLINAWGIATSPKAAALWVSDNGADLSTLYNGAVAGSPFGKTAPVVSIPGGAPTGQVFNSTSDFVVHSGSASGPAFFIFASENGSITGWNPKVPPPVFSTQAQMGVTVPNAVYKGIALGNNGAANYLYATNFRTGQIDVFDTNFKQVSLAGSFTDPNLPAGFAPFNIADLGGKLYVTYAKQDAAKHDDVKGPGNGFIDVYDTNGNFLDRLVSGTPGDATSPLNSPWGMVLATSNFGDLSGDLLVGNFGDGRINAFNPTTGAYLGTLNDPSGKPIVIDGLWGLQFGNGVTAGDPNTLYFAAGPDGEQHGLFGALETAQATPLAGIGAKVAATEGESLSNAWATFAASATAAQASDFTASIAWGDGATSAGTVVAGADGGFNVLGTHTYAEQGNESVVIVVRDGQSHAITLQASASVGDAPLSITATTLRVDNGLTVSSSAVATFTDAGGADPVADYTATIDWGDGTSATAGVVSAAAGTLSIGGQHQYSAPGRYTATVTLRDEGGRTATATAQIIMGSDHERLVEQMFNDLLDRKPDDGALNYFNAQLDQGAAASRMAALIESSPEYHERETQGLFRLFLHRQADADALRFFGGLLAEGDTVEQVEAMIVASPEYFQNRAGGAGDGFVDALFNDALHRDADAGAKSFFERQSLADPSARARAAAMVFGSQEFDSHLVNFPEPHAVNPFHDQVTHGFYQAYLGRDADPSGLDAFVNALQHGERDEQVVAAIVGSPEYAARV